MAEQSVTPRPGENFRRAELVARLRSLADLTAAYLLPAPRFDRTPTLEFHLHTDADVDQVAAAIGTTPKRHGLEYFTGIENAELRVRWTALHKDNGLDFSRPADGGEPQQIGQREPLHTVAVTEDGLVDEGES